MFGVESGHPSFGTALQRVQIVADSAGALGVDNLSSALFHSEEGPCQQEDEPPAGFLCQVRRGDQPQDHNTRT